MADHVWSRLTICLYLALGSELLHFLHYLLPPSLSFLVGIAFHSTLLASRIFFVHGLINRQFLQETHHLFRSVTPHAAIFEY
jgi:hypothetical protein